MTGLFYLTAVIAVVWLAIWAASDDAPHGASAARRRRNKNDPPRWNPFEFAVATIEDVGADGNGSTNNTRPGRVENRPSKRHSHSAPPPRTNSEPRWRSQRRTQRQPR